MKKDSGRGRPEPGVEYRLTGGPGEAAISNGNTWEQARVTPVFAIGEKVRVRVGSREFAGTVTEVDAKRGLVGVDCGGDGLRHVRPSAVAKELSREINTSAGRIRIRPAGKGTAR